MKLYAIRHTSVAVEPGICYGQSDVDVAASFLQEMNAVKEEISGNHFHKIFSSPLQRCRKLAEHLFPNQQILFDDRLKELNFGEWELKCWDAIYNSPLGKHWMEDYQNLPTLNGESYPEMRARIAEWLNELKAEELEALVVVSHAGVIRVLKHLTEGHPMEKLFAEFKPSYGSVTIFNLNDSSNR